MNDGSALRDPICLRILCLIAFVAAGCRSMLPPRSTEPPPAPSEQSAWVVFFTDENERFNPLLSVRDEQGRLLGRVRGRSWFAVERPPGLQWFFAGEVFHLCHGDPSRGRSSVGALSAHLEAGRIYLVRATAYQGRRRSIAERFRAMNSGCCMSDDDDGRPTFLDLVGVRPGGSEWIRALDVLREGIRYSAAPRGLEERSVSQLPAQGRARFGRCIDIERSQLSPEDGSRFWPLTPVDPSDALVF